MGGHIVHAGNPLSLTVFWLGVAMLVTSIVIVRREGTAIPQRFKGYAPAMVKKMIAAVVLVGVMLSATTFALSPLSSPQFTPPVSQAGQSCAKQPFKAVKVDPDNFHWKGLLASYTNEENYFPKFSGSKAVVTVRNGMTSGTLSIGIMDGVGTWVLRGKTITSQDEPTVTFTTQDGRTGVWMVILSFNKVSGEVEVIVTPAGA